jgi:hypothetical protein
MAKDPSDMVHDTFRERDFCGVKVPMNSKSATDDCFVDQGRLKTRTVTEYCPSKNPNKPGTFTERHVKVSIMDNARSAVGAMGVRGSYAARDEAEKIPSNNKCCDAYDSRENNPLTRSRGDE